MNAGSAAAFTLPPALEAHEPPEARGVRRDRVRLLVAQRGSGAIAHRRFDELPDILNRGDLLVVNTSPTLPAAIDALDRPLQVRFSTAAPHLPGGWHVVEIRTRGGAAPVRPGTVAAGERIALAGGDAAVVLVAPYAQSTRLWLAQVQLAGDATSVAGHLAAHGTPVRYGYVPRAWPLAAYQTAFARDGVPGGDGSAEMPSAARPFTPELVTRLVSAGVLFAPLTLHTGVSSPERREPPYPEAYDVPDATARLVDAVRRWGGRVIAVGTTAVRALETVADCDGRVAAGAGWTELVIGPDRPPRVVDGLITGWHEPEASHLHLLEAIAGTDLLDASYRAALDHGYLWHEFGDSHLVLP
ncbi:MAG TPA: S-adenosylmethionine:tRNA ribosyltransferase-isomerase [Baekduia sp.]|nr:S-adenosylmethionine:tRNA ribosyltransferase-isomerase [Baekduia sp.]